MNQPPVTKHNEAQLRGAQLKMLDILLAVDAICRRHGITYWPDNGTLYFICRLNDDKEVHDEQNWYEANPSLQYFPNLLRELRKEYENWKIDPNNNSSFMTKRMNRPQ